MPNRAAQPGPNDFNEGELSMKTPIAIKPVNMTPEQLKQAILDGVASVESDGQGKDGLQGFLAKLARENPQLAKAARSHAGHFAEAGYGPRQS
jgi:hypothetical protein